MTKLELINKEIEDVKDYFRDRKKYNLQSKLYTFERLKLLEQIKTELEIMELIKNGWSSMDTTLAGDQIIRFQNLKIDDWIKLWNRLEEISLKKALEVKDND